MNIRKYLKKGRYLVFLGFIVAIALGALGCVKGLAPIGWSGGATENGTIYVGARDGTLTAVDIADSSRQKAEALKGQSQGGLFGCNAAYGEGCSGAVSHVAIYGTPAFAGDLVYIGGYNGKVYAYSTSNLAVRWVYPRDTYVKPIVGSVVTDGSQVYFGDSSGTFYALNAATGDLVWSYQTGDKIWGAPTISDGTVYIGSFDKKLYALNAADGTLKWTFEAGGSFIAPPVVKDGVLYVGAFDREFYAIDAATGQQKWSFRAGNWFWSRGVIISDVIYVPCLDGKVYELRLSDGAEVTSYDTGENIPSGLALDGTNLILASENGTVYKIDTVANKMTTLTTIDKLTVDGPVLIDNGIIYIQDSSNQLIRIDEETGAVMTPIALTS